MDISSISQYYDLQMISLKPAQLLLDPNNPRIREDVKTVRKFDEREILKPETQEYILSVINKKVHHIADLIRDIRNKGFIASGDDMIVRKTVRPGKYLVLEGNRRLAAIKSILGEQEGLKPGVRGTLLSLRVKEFNYSTNLEFSEEAVIDILLGLIHIKGRLDWSAIERASYIYNSYLREMRKASRSFEFSYKQECAGDVAVLFNVSKQAVKKEIIVYRVYEDLKRQNYNVKPDRFSLISMAVSSRSVGPGYFELDPDTLQFSKKGAARFNNLCMRENSPISNPVLFRDFVYIFDKGTEYELGQLENGGHSIGEILERIESRNMQNDFLSKLNSIRAKLEELQPADHRSMRSEAEVILRIKKLVDDKLFRLI